MNKPLILKIIGCILLSGSLSPPLPLLADESSAPTVSQSAPQLVQSAQQKLRAAKSLGDYVAARKDLLQAVAADPKSASAQFWLAEATRWATRYASTQPMTALAGALGDPALLDPDEAIRRYSLVIGLDPKMARAYFGRGSFYLERGTSEDNARAQQDFSNAILLDPKFAAAYLARALAYGRAGKFDFKKLLADYDKAIALGIPANGEDEAYEKILAPRLKAAIYSGRAAFYRQQGENDKALTDFNKAIALDANALEARVQRAKVFQETNQLDKALADLNFVLENQPNFGAALMARADIYRQQKVREKARADVRRVFQLGGAVVIAKDAMYEGLSESVEAQKRGDEWLVQNALDEAQTEYSRAIEADKENVFAYAGRAAARMRRGELEAAQADLDAALKLQSDNVKLLTLRGQVLARRGQPDKALQDLAKATQLAPDDVAAWEQTGIVQQVQGDYESAEKSYDKAIGFAALSIVSGATQGASTSLADVRRLIARAAQGLEDDWKTEIANLPPPKLRAGILICEIEIKKHPDSEALQKLREAFTLKQTG